jgi:coenzyme Q-binding protein COQ10
MVSRLRKFGYDRPMKSFSNRRRVDFAAADMFALVADVENYPKFVPLCDGLRVRRRSALSESVEVIIAEMEVGFKAVCERYTSRITCNRDKLEIIVEYIDGPFKKLDNRWLFRDEPTPEGGAAKSVVDFHIAYEFRSLALGMLMGAMFDRAFQKYSDAFVKRAGEVYGRR